MSPACLLQLCLLLGGTITSSILMGTASSCLLVSPLVLWLLGSPGPACCSPGLWLSAVTLVHKTPPSCLRSHLLVALSRQLQEDIKSPL